MRDEMPYSCTVYQICTPFSLIYLFMEQQKKWQKYGTYKNMLMKAWMIQRIKYETVNQVSRTSLIRSYK